MLLEQDSERGSLGLSRHRDAGVGLKVLQGEPQLTVIVVVVDASKEVPEIREPRPDAGERLDGFEVPHAKAESVPAERHSYDLFERMDACAHRSVFVGVNRAGEGSDALDVDRLAREAAAIPLTKRDVEQERAESGPKRVACRRGRRLGLALVLRDEELVGTRQDFGVGSALAKR